MTNLPEAILHVFCIFAPLFSRPVYKNALQLFLGHILCKGRRTVADILRALNLKNLKNYSKFHWVLNGAKWNSFKGSKLLFLQLIQLIEGELIVVIDSTLERRKGPKIQGLGRHHDSARSSKDNKTFSFGLNWLVSSLVIQLPFTKLKWSLPFLTILMPPRKVLASSQNKKDLKKKNIHKKMTRWASQIVLVVRRWAGKVKKITFVADSAFACFDLAYVCIDQSVGLISRIRLDARLYNFLPDHLKGSKRRVAGKVLPKLSVLAEKNIEQWEEVEIKWYGGSTRKVFIQSGKCLWYYVGFPPISIHWVLIKFAKNSNSVALFSTDLNYNALKIIELYVERWSIEVTFEEARRHLGMETQRQWSDEAIAKTTPVVLASFSIITLMGMKLSRENKEKIPQQLTSWYKKDHITFSDVLAYVREAIVRAKFNSLVGKKTDQRRKEFEDLISQLAAA